MRLFIQKHWYEKNYILLNLFLVPISWLFRLIVFIRKFLFRIGILSSRGFSVPIIVVGNITVGGTGKTPLVIWLAHFLRNKGLQPGIVSRGVGGMQQRLPRWVEASDSAELFGDEAILLAKKSGCPVVIGKDRSLAVEMLLAKSNCNVVISDDGLQHYGLARDIEIVVIDGERQLGNKKLLPAGPLRESTKRLKQVNFVVQSHVKEKNGFCMQYQGNELVSLKNEKKIPLDHFANKTVHAFAATGNPKRFFQNLRAAGLNIIEHVFADHYLYQPNDFFLQDGLPILMTEKDSVKCLSFSDERFWYLPIEAVLDDKFEESLWAVFSSYPSTYHL
jgi:tetraacyldisaccharide 4'-kinase